MVLTEITQAFFIALLAVFLMELGDKTQLTAFTLGLKFRAPKKVFMGVLLGLFAVTLISVTLGQILKNSVEIEILKPLIAGLFILGGALFLINELKDKKDESSRICPVSLDLCEQPRENCTKMNNCDLYLDNTVRKGAFLKSISFIFFAELGDKTMIMSLGLATNYNPVGVFLGALLALGLVNGVGVFAGDKIATLIPRRTLTIVSGALFILVGIVIGLF
ncbi:MAG: TMEM165/GDT1 family protein [Candidatus Hodarchaeales archaeon]|jgi:putative Ca2+/H+ antiporter (TMEM165/GDT1 family)